MSRSNNVLGFTSLVGVCGRSVVELGIPSHESQKDGRPYRYIPYNSADSEAPGERSQSNLTQFCCSKTCLALGSWGSQTTDSLQVQKSPAMAAMGHQACLVGSSASAQRAPTMRAHVRTRSKCIGTGTQPRKSGSPSFDYTLPWCTFDVPDQSDKSRSPPTPYIACPINTAGWNGGTFTLAEPLF